MKQVRRGQDQVDLSRAEFGTEPQGNGPPHLGHRTCVSLVLIEFFLQRERVLHCTDGSHRGTHKNHAPGVGDDDGRVDDVKC